MGIIHRGVELSQAQLDAILPVLNESMNGMHKGRKFVIAIDKALDAAGLGVPKNEDEPPPAPIA